MKYLKKFNELLGNDRYTFGDSSNNISNWTNPSLDWYYQEIMDLDDDDERKSELVSLLSNIEDDSSEKDTDWSDKERKQVIDYLSKIELDVKNGKYEDIKKYVPISDETRKDNEETRNRKPIPSDIKSAKDFNIKVGSRVNEEEGWKENILVGLMSLLGVSGIAQTSHKSDDGNKRFYKTKTEKTANNMIKRGWTLDSVQVDTLWAEVITKKPDTLVMVTRLSLDKDQYFASGKFELSQDVKDSISTTLNGISNDGGVITDIRVESSTDKQGLSANLQKQLKGMRYSGDNKGLSQARSEAVTNYLVEMGVNDSLIETSQKYEMGEKTIEQSARYVNVDIVYLVVDQEVTPAKTVDVPKVNKTYFLSIPKTGGSYTHHKTTYKFKGGNRKTVKMGPIKHHKSRKSVVDRCYFD